MQSFKGSASGMQLSRPISQSCLHSHQSMSQSQLIFNPPKGGSFNKSRLNKSQNFKSKEIDFPFVCVFISFMDIKERWGRWRVSWDLSALWGPGYRWPVCWEDIHHFWHNAPVNISPNQANKAMWAGVSGYSSLTLLKRQIMTVTLDLSTLLRMLS